MGRFSFMANKNSAYTALFLFHLDIEVRILGVRLDERLAGCDL